jgi:hypothetical protein
VGTEQPDQDPSWCPAPGETVVRGNLRITNMTGIPTHAATGTHRVVNRCRAGHEEIIEVHSDNELIEAMTAACRVCGGMVNVSRHIGPDGVGIGTILVPDERPGSPEGAHENPDRPED